MPRITITRNPGALRIGRHNFGGRRFSHATLPGARGRRLHLIWAGPLFILTIPRGA
jgi:hypothetical protein